MRIENIEEMYPLSPMQQGMLFHNVYDRENEPYFQQLDCILRGELNISAFKQAWQRAVDRHPIFRTAFMWEELDEPIQVVCRDARLPVEQQDWRGLSSTQQHQRLKEYLEADRIRGFELSDPPLMRLAILRIADKAYQFVWSCHHLLIDGWSTPILLKEVFAFYTAFCNGQDLELELPRPYKDYIAWLQQQDMLEAEKFWRETLEGFSTPTQLQVPRPQNHAQDRKQITGEQRRQLSEITTQRLQSLASQHHLTLNTIAQGAWALLLSRYSGERDVVFGATVSGRPANLAGSHEMIGVFINTLPTRIGLPDGENLISWMKGFQARQVEARQYEYSPLVNLQAWSDVPGGVALFESILVFENFPVDRSLQKQVRQNSLLEISDVHVEKQTNYPLALVMAPGQMSILMIYNRERFPDEVIARMLEHFETLLESIAARPDQRLASICLLRESESEQTLARWNDTRAQSPEDLCLHEVFETQARQNPQAIAAVFQDCQLSYSELNSRANQLGHYLQSLGVGPEVKVGIYIRRSLDLIIGILGILKAGAAYVPLDPEYPLERLALILNDIQSPVLLTQDQLIDELPGTWAEVICLDSDWDLIAGSTDTDPISHVAGGNLAYTIYTSGSTGIPKGVMVSHRSLINYLRWCNEAYSVSEGEGCPVHSRIGFDLTITSLFSPLLSGRRVTFIAEDAGIEGLSQMLRREKNYSLVKITPAHLEVLNNLLPSAEATGRTNALIIGGEALKWEDLSFWLEHSPATKLINEYGPTETVVGCCVYEATRGMVGSGDVPIGRPISNTQIYILDVCLQPLPAGVAGEIYIGGTGVARGYLNQPDQTGEKFIPNAFTTEPGARLYKTGDLARYLPDGNIEFIGRIDEQIKLRGHRIELGEIENVLNRHPAISDCAVIVREDAAGQNRLLAYLIPDKERAFAIERLVKLESEGLLEGKSLYELSNGMTIAHLNKNETDLLYREIFENRSYLMHGITLGTSPCIFDVGANIGMFTLFAGQICKDATIYAFEPIPAVFDTLRINTALYGLNVKLFQCGIGNVATNDTFTYYPHASVLSGRFANPMQEQENVSTVLLNEHLGADGVIALDEKLVQELLKERLTTESVICQLLTISDVIRENGVERIDLLKIDVEKSELDVLEGIDEEDWQKIRQIVVEVHDFDNRLDHITSLLESKGYYFVVDQDRAYQGTDLYNIYAARQANQGQPSSDRNEKAAPPPNGKWESADRLIKDIREFLKAKLPSHMIPSVFTLLDSLPLTPNGKVDRRALPAPDHKSSETREAYLAPRTPVEEIIADVWAKVLGHERVSVTADFFELGGHSLLATQVISRLREAFQWEVPLQTLFDAPTVAELAASIETTSHSQQSVSIPPIRPAPDHLPLPLSFAQQRLWFLDQLEPGNSGYNISDPVRFQGVLNIHALRRTRDEIVRRHETLRTTFSMMNGQPIQVINPPVSQPLPVIDLSELEQGEAEEEAHKLATEEANEPFDLERGPLLRVSLIKLRQEDHVVLFTMHHIISDGWSMGVLVEEVAELYEAYSKGEESRLEELPIQYADYAVWQREWLRGEVVEEEIKYWKEQLEGAPAVIGLPTDRPRAAIRSHRGAREKWEISKEVAEKMREVSREEGVTMFMSMLAGFQVLLGRYSGEEDIVVGTPIANRRRVELEKLIGFFANTLVMRTKLEWGESYKGVVKGVRRMAIEAYGHQDVPFEMLVEEMEPERTMSRTPMFQVMFMMLNVPGEALELRELRLSSFEVESNTSKFDLTLAMAGTPVGLSIMVEYSTDLFDQVTIRRMLTHFETLLENIAEEPHRKINELSLLKESERQQLLVDWNQTKREYNEQRCIHQWFEQQVEKQATAVAVAYEGEMLSYGELNKRSNQLAHYLIKKGVKVEDIIGICVERSMEMVVGVLGALKAGAAYVPLDPTYPAERLAYMIADSQIKVLLTQAGIREELPNESVDVVCMDDDRDRIASCSVLNPVTQVSPDNLLYVIYTSGSTGRPKGIGLSHRALANLIEWHFTTLSQGANTLQYASLSFDASFHETFSTLCSGGTLYIVPEYLRADIAKLGEYINQARIKKAILPVVVLQQLAELKRSRAEELAGLREIIATGEQLQITSAIKELFKQLKGSTLDNHYGPSETHVVTWKRLDERAERWAPHVPIGKPISNTQVYVFDSRMQPVPVGVIGELHIAGTGLARGYVNQAALTAERFIPDPYGPEPGRRLYKTGDLARYLSNGDIEFVGRKDHQVKVRGYRVEMAEVEAVLSEHTGVEEVIVTATQGGSADKRLVAYVVLQNDQENYEEELKKYARRRMPEYMVPSVIVRLEHMPLTANGKVDRRALPMPDPGVRDIKQEIVLPRTQAEQVLAGIWSNVLGVQEVGIYDNFFSLGGHSILAALTIFRMREAFHLDLPLRSLFEFPTIDGLINLIVGIYGSPDTVEQIAQTFLDLQQLSEGEIKALLCKIESE